MMISTTIRDQRATTTPPVGGTKHQAKQVKKQERQPLQSSLPTSGDTAASHSNNKDKKKSKNKAQTTAASTSSPGYGDLSIDPLLSEPIDESVIAAYNRWFLRDDAPEHLQPTLNLGTLGHVAHGKSSITRALSGVRTQRFDVEQRKNLTIKLGYANFKIYRCSNAQCPPPVCYASWGSKQISHPPCSRPGCGHSMNLVRHVSIVDCPGHECLMATMLNGAAVMDAALLVIAANEPVPQPQTAEHLIAAEILGLENLIVIQNKMDLITRDKAYENLHAVKEFVAGTVAEDSPTIPLCAAPSRTCNIDVLLQYIVEKIPLPKRDLSSPSCMRVVRSFDVNKPGDDWGTMKGGVAGGTLLRGLLKIGQDVEVRPGLIQIDQSTGRYRCRPFLTRVVALFSENTPLQVAYPGGLIAVGTTLDPTLTKSDRLVGQVIGAVGTLANVYLEIDISFSLMKRVLAATNTTNTADPSIAKVRKISKGDVLLVNIGASSATATVISTSGSARARVLLKKPTCVEIGQKISISRHFTNTWRLVGYGMITSGEPLALEPF